MKCDRTDIIMIAWGGISLLVITGVIGYMMAKPKNNTPINIVEPLDLLSDCMTVKYHDKSVALDDEIRKVCEKIMDTWKKVRKERSLRRLKESLNEAQ